MPAANVAIVTEAVRNMDVSIDTPQDMSQILADGGLTPFDIDAVILSHAHFDHIGDLGAFPSTTRLIVGPGFQKEFLPGYPADPNSMILHESIKGHNIQEVDFINATLEIHGLRALDLFEDGSFYLLDTPGHEVGHISALARTTSTTPTGGSPSFMLLAGDVCHHSGALRPSPQAPLPVSMGNNCSSGKFEGEYLAKMLRRCGGGVKPFYQPSPGGFNKDAWQMSATIRSVQLFDADPQCFVVLAHDRWLRDVIDLFPQSANGWHGLGWADKSRWEFLKDFELNKD